MVRYFDEDGKKLTGTILKLEGIKVCIPEDTVVDGKLYKKHPVITTRWTYQDNRTGKVIPADGCWVIDRVKTRKAVEQIANIDFDARFGDLADKTFREWCLIMQDPHEAEIFLRKYSRKYYWCWCNRTTKETVDPDHIEVYRVTGYAHEISDQDCFERAYANAKLKTAFTLNVKKG